MSQRHIVVIGNGISGTTLARHVRKRSDDTITIISSESDYFYSRPALMYVYMGHMPQENTKPYEDRFWSENRINLRRAHVNRVDTFQKVLHLDDHSTMSYDVLVIASGSHSNPGSWHGSHFEGVQGLVSLQDLSAMESNTQNCSRAVVVGGGLIGVEMVEMLRSRGIHVTYLVREFKFWSSALRSEESDIVERHIIADHGVELHTQTELKEILGDENGKVRAVLTTKGDEIPCSFVGIAIGVKPNIAFLQESGIETGSGILVNERFETSAKDVYAIGDCAEFRTALSGRTKIEQIWYTGRMQAETLAATLTGTTSVYRPVNFFNSAKLFDIEFQVYSRNVKIPDTCSSVFWMNHHRRCAIRLFYDPQTLRFEGVTLLGVRYRHEVCDRWLCEERDIEYVLCHLSDANFDPEFFRHYENFLVEEYNAKSGKQLQLKKRSWKRIFQGTGK